MLPLQLGIAVVAVLGFGLLHGASDLALVRPAARPMFLGAYLLVIGATWLLWREAPTAGLLLLLALSVAHFGLDDAPPERPGERVARGVAMIAAPGLLHRTDLAGLFDAITARPALSAGLASGLAVAGAATVALLCGIGLRRRDGRLLLGVAALTLPPPLVGFSLGFVILHAAPQTLERIRLTGCVGWRPYLRLVAPVMAGAFAVVALTALLLRDAPAPSLAALFAAIAALALPHMLVTPLFSASAPAPRPNNRRSRASSSARTSPLPHI